MTRVPRNYDASAFFATLKRQGRSLAWLADEIGYERGYVRKIKAGFKPATHEFAERASRALALPMDLLFLPLDLRERNKNERERPTSDAAAD